LKKVLKLINDPQPKTISSREKDNTTNNKNIFPMSFSARKFFLLRAHNVLDKDGLCEHGSSVKLNGKMQKNHVVGEIIVF
jgi:hypothetical protein